MSTHRDNCWGDILEDRELRLQFEEAASATMIWEGRVKHNDLVCEVRLQFEEAASATMI